MRAVITIDDQSHGVGVTVFMEDGFDPKSLAHQTCATILAHLDSLGESGPVSQQTITGEAAEWITAPILAADDIQAKPA